MNRLLLFVFTLIFYAFSQETKTAAVMELSGSGIEPSDIQTLTSKLGSELVKQNVFTVLERSEMGLILQEQGFQQTGCTSSECAVEIGQVLGVQYIVTGSIGKIEDMYYIEVRMVDVGSSKIAKTADRNVHGTLKDVLIEAIPAIAAELSGNIAITTVPQKKEIQSSNTPLVTAQPEVRKKKKIVPILLGTLGLAGAGAGTYFYLQSKKETTETPTTSTGQVTITLPSFRGVSK